MKKKKTKKLSTGSVFFLLKCINAEVPRQLYIVLITAKYPACKKQSAKPGTWQAPRPHEVSSDGHMKRQSSPLLLLNERILSVLSDPYSLSHLFCISHVFNDVCYFVLHCFIYLFFTKEHST